MFNRRVPKTHPRVMAYGTVDELNAALGMVRAFCENAFVCERVLEIQRDLVLIMGELAVSSGDLERYAQKGHPPVGAAMVDRLSAQVTDLETNHNITYKGWATPGATKGSACLDVARTVCRRAEREVVFLTQTGAHVNPEIVRYLNRLSDLCWLWARWVETVAERPPEP
jgi:cob(I)alamin adenosyltransferase